MEEFKIEFALKSDALELLELVQQLAKFEKAEDQVNTQLADYEEGLENGYFRALIARNQQQKIIGMALYYPIFSTWNGRTMYLEDFVVMEQYRGQGVGKLLFERWMEESKRMGVKMLKWQVLDWNESAKWFYRKYNTKFYPGWENGVIHLNQK